ncbi:hypothetical protein D3C80_2060900 [compost metagenome]
MATLPQYGHGHFCFLRRDATGMHEWVTQELIVKRGHSIGRFLLNEQAKVFGMPINGRQNPEDDLAFKEGVSIE